MRNFRAYHPIDYTQLTSVYQLSTTISHHLSNVLRLSSGTLIELFDGQGHAFEAKIGKIGKQIEVEILSEKENKPKENSELSLIIGLGKGEKMDWILQKATELGVRYIQPVHTARSEVRLSSEREQKKYQHWQEILISACTQCGQNTLPSLKPITHFSKGCQEAQNGLKLLFHPEHSAPNLIMFLEKTTASAATLLIGPEGGFSSQELTEAHHCGFLTASLGPRILRMETAALAALSIVGAFLNKDSTCHAT